MQTDINARAAASGASLVPVRDTRRHVVFKRLLCLLCAVCMLLPQFGLLVLAEEQDGPALTQQTIELYPDVQDTEKTVTLNGLMPENASAEVTDLTEDYPLLTDFNTTGSPELTDEEQRSTVLAAYDIKISDGEREFQPDEQRPIFVEITNPVISTDRLTLLWHIKDDGTRERVTDVTIEDRKISFPATGFSIYAIVDVPSPLSAVQVANRDELRNAGEDEGFVLFYGANSYFTSGLNSKNCLIETTDIDQAAVWHFEPTGDDNEYRIYTYVNGEKKYIETKSGNEIKLGDTGDVIEITNANKGLYLKKKNEGRWLQHSNGGGGIRYYTDNNNATNSIIKMYYADSVNPPDDYCHLNGKTFGIMNYPGGTAGNALMADGEGHTVAMNSLVVRTDTGRNSLYVAEDSDISMWSFHSVSGNDYLLSTTVDGETKYLKMDNGGITLVDSESQASVLTVSTNDQNRLMLSCGGRSLSFENGAFTTSPTNTGNAGQWMNLVELSGLTAEDYVTYAADRASISDVPDGSRVIVYTRIWNESTKSYDYYAIDHDGSLYPCYARGDQIMWVGSRIETMLWDFTEYHYDDGTPNYYYELYNPYSQQYIAPQISNGQMLSDSPIGINMPGRRDGEYYSDIIAWDDPYYSYASLTNDIANGTVASGYKFEADTYYFALVELPTASLTKVDTIDNAQYGITMKMVDFPAQTNSGGGFVGVQSNFLGNYNGFTQGLLSTHLDENGYPTVTANGNNLGDLYAGLAPGGSYNGATEVNHLFIESILRTGGYFEFDSCQNFATLLDENGNRTNDFTVYKELGTNDTTYRTTLSHGQFFPYNNIKPGVYSTKNPENLYSALAIPGEPNTGLLPDTDPRKYEKLYTVTETTNYYNGMEMSAGFIQTPSGKDAWGHDIIFEFTGDDDFWLYVDGELIIDLGGIHSALEGKVNFATGDVVVNGVHKTLRQVFTENFMTRNPDATQSDVDAYLADYFEPGETVFKDYSQHDMRIFYMERGAGASNLHMRFNLSYATPGHVMLTKQVTGTDDIDFNLVEYPFQIYYKTDPDGPETLLTNLYDAINVTYQNSTTNVEYRPTYSPPGSNVSYNSVYFLNPGMTAEIHFPADTIEYRIVECGINPEVYDQVNINGTAVTGLAAGDSNRQTYDSGWLVVKDNPTMLYDNHVNEENLRTLSITKQLWDEHGKTGNRITAEQDPTGFSFRLYLSNGVTDELELANMVDYRVRDPDGNLCIWDVVNQRFSSIGVTDPGALTTSQRTQCTFQTSMNGAISKIPSGYTVEVPNLPVGMKFMVVERENEIPLGYQLIDYERDAGSYIQAEDGEPNVGWIRHNESPHMFVNNKRGFGLQINKIWSDKDYVSSHDPIYVAVYVNGQLLPGTVRQIAHPSTSCRYFFDELANGATIRDYKLYEVTLENPVVDGSGSVTAYDGITRIEEAGNMVLNAIPRNGTTPSEYTYTAHYEEGEPVATSGTAGEENARTDTVTNTRTGGVVLTKYDKHTNQPLAGATFTLKHGNTVIGTFTSDAQGRITVMYDAVFGDDYTLTETRTPAGYVGLPEPEVFSVASDGQVTLSDDGTWITGHPATDPDDDISAYIDVFNKPFTLQLKKTDAVTGEPLEGAHFELYRSVAGIGGEVMDVRPMIGYTSDVLISDENGIVPHIDSTLPAGKYYLVETSAPPGYTAFDDVLPFTITGQGEVVINNTEYANHLQELSTADEISYVISVPNSPSKAELTVTKTVSGAFGNLNKQFTFTLTVAGASAEDEFSWTKNGTPQTEPLHSGGTFTLKHNDTVTIELPKYVDITVSENNENYDASFRLGDAAAEDVNTKTFVLTDDVTLAVTNVLDGVIITGVDAGRVLPVLLITLSMLTCVAVLYVQRRRREDILYIP